MKVILNKDLAPLGEEGDVKEVAKGYARNYLFPRGIALPYNDRTIKLFESRREEIELKKAQKRNDAAGIKEKLESLNIEISMPAGANGKLYGAVTNHTVWEELNKLGFQIERKRIEIQGMSIKSIGKYKVLVKLYESASAEITVTVMGQEIKSESRSSPASRPGRNTEGRRRREGAPGEDSSGEAAIEPDAESAVNEAAIEPDAEPAVNEAALANEE